MRLKTKLSGRTMFHFQCFSLFDWTSTNDNDMRSLHKKSRADENIDNSAYTTNELTMSQMNTDNHQGLFLLTTSVRSIYTTSLASRALWRPAELICVKGWAQRTVALCLNDARLMSWPARVNGGGRGGARAGVLGRWQLSDHRLNIELHGHSSIWLYTVTAQGRNENW